MQEQFDRAISCILINLNNLATIQPMQKLATTNCIISITEGAFTPIRRAVAGESRDKVIKFISHEVDSAIIAASGIAESIYMTESAIRAGENATRMRIGQLEDIQRGLLGAKRGLEQLAKTYAGDMNATFGISVIETTIAAAMANIDEVLSKKIYLGRMAVPLDE